MTSNAADDDTYSNFVDDTIGVNDDDDSDAEGKIQATEGDGGIKATFSTTLSASLSPKIGSYKEIVVFAGTTIIIWLSKPLLSLVDTTIVGKFSSIGSSTILNSISPELIQ